MSDAAAETGGLLPGRATQAGTRRYVDRIIARRREAGLPTAEDHFARPDDLWLSSLSLGTLRGDPGGVDDLLYRSVVVDLLERAEPDTDAFGGRGARDRIGRVGAHLAGKRNEVVTARQRRVGADHGRCRKSVIIRAT